MKVKDIMTKNIITASKDSKIYEVAQKMKEYNIGFIPITDQQKIIGVITDRDIVTNCISNNNDKNEIVENYINRNIITVNIDDNIEDALNIMSTNKIKRLLVLNDKKIVGIISLANLLTTDSEEKILSTIKSIWITKDNTKNKDVEIDDYYL